MTTTAQSWDEVLNLAAPALAPPRSKLATTALVTRESGKAHHRNRVTVGRSARTDLPPAGAPHPKAPRRLVPLTPMRHAAAKSMRKLAAGLQDTHPDMSVHDHVRDAARTLESGNEEAAQRHLRAAMFSLSPQSVMRNGLHTDDAHIAARQAVHGLHRHLLLIKDIQDVGAKNRAALAKQAGGDDTASPPPSPDPNAGWGPGALAQKPTARQPGGDLALNAPARTNSGGSDPAVADPVGVQPKGSKQFARHAKALDIAAIDLARGPGKHPPAGKMSKAQLALHLTAFHHRPAAAAPGQPTAKAMQARHAVLHRVMAAADAGPGIPHVHGAGSVPEAAAGLFARSWAEVEAQVVDLSAETGRLAGTPALYGKPGGPGLYGVKGLKHSDYLEQIVQALRRKGMNKGQATAIARGDLRKWMRGGGKVTPEVRAAATAAEAQEVAAQARAHAHARTWDDVDIDLAAASR